MMTEYALLTGLFKFIYREFLKLIESLLVIRYFSLDTTDLQ